MAVDDGRDLVGAADAAGVALAEFGTRLGGQFYLGHDCTPRGQTALHCPVAVTRATTDLVRREERADTVSPHPMSTASLAEQLREFIERGGAVIQSCSIRPDK
ncbi:hypothetical protein GCM10009544_51020 [Streptomyces stramineus]|uniref:Uncharacterized protein n=1 Tax=Streptomyces stramineus TaxID=173861 RepID=A0ABP3KMJ1_9ACTN